MSHHASSSRRDVEIHMVPLIAGVVQSVQYAVVRHAPSSLRVFDLSSFTLALEAVVSVQLLYSDLFRRYISGADFRHLAITIGVKPKMFLRELA